MKRFSPFTRATLGAAFSLFCTALSAQVPTNFNGVATTIYDPGAIAPGLVFVASCGQPGDKGPFFLQIMDNDGTPHAFKTSGNLTPGDDFYAYDFKVLPDGRLFYAQYTNWFSCLDGGPVLDQILDEDFNPVETIGMGNGYQAESHDFELLPNGHVLVIGYYTTLADLRSVLPGALPRAEVSGTIVQELDALRNVVWQWRTWDHLTWDQFSGWGTNCGSVVVGMQANAVRQDPIDGNLLLATSSEQMKINRQTGDVMWRLGGAFNQFSFVGVTLQEGLRQLAGNDFHRLPNGDYILLNNGVADGSRTSQVHEYQLDETNKVATHVWQYIPSNTIATSTRGSAQRLPNGNTFIGWGSSASGQNPDCTEVTPGGTKVFELSFTNASIDSYRAFRFPFPPSAQHVRNVQYSVRAGNTYNFTDTGVSIQLTDVAADAYNSVTVTNEPYAPLNPLFSDRTPILLPARVSLTGWFIDSLSGVIYFDPAVLSLANPASLTVYRRPTPDEAFVAIPTAYDDGTGLLAAELVDTGLGDYAFGTPDLAEVAFEPLLLEPASLQTTQSTGVVTCAPGPVQPGQSYTVNQQLPISLAWCPIGFADYYNLQIATTPDFADPVVDQSYITEASYTFSDALPNTTYFWRVSTIYSYLDPDGDITSDWATNAFATVPPAIHVIAPNGGEVLCRGQAAIVQWDANINENVAIDLYKSGSFVSTIASSIPSTVSYSWQIDPGLTPGADYSLKIKSVTSPGTVFDTSDLHFSIIDWPVLGPGSVTMLSDRRVRLNLNVPGAPQATVFGSTNLSSWELLQTVPLTGGTAVFTDDSAPTNRARFYRLRVP
jgi:hypothetical protein